MGEVDTYTLKFDASGNIVWAKQVKGLLSDFATDLAVDGSGSVYVVGIFIGSSSFDNITVTGKGHNDVYLVKYSTAGNVEWVKTFGEQSSDIGTDVTVDGVGNVYITGFFRGTTKFGNVTLSTPDNSTTFNDAFVVKVQQNDSQSYLWYADQANVLDTIVNGVSKKQFVDLDGLTADAAFRERYTVDGLGAPVATDATTRARFLDAYQRMHWSTLPESNIVSMNTYPVTGLASIAALLDNKQLDATDLQDYQLIKVRFTAPACEEQCMAKEFPKTCSNTCSEKYESLEAEVTSAYEDLSAHTGTYTYKGAGSFSLKQLVDVYYPLDKVTQMDMDAVSVDALNLYLAYDVAVIARNSFDMQACQNSCNGQVTPDVTCQMASANYNSCVYEYMDELNQGYEYFLTKWDEKGGYPYATLDELQSATGQPNLDERDQLGKLLFDYLVANFRASADLSRTAWEAVGGTCTNCTVPGSTQIIGGTQYNCPAGTARDLSDFPSKLIPLLNSAAAACKTAYDEELLKASNYDLYICQENYKNCVAALGPNASAADLQACQDANNCDVSTANSTQPVREAMIRETVSRLYISAETIETKVSELTTQTASMTLAQLTSYLPDYETEERCRLECKGYFETAFKQWIESNIAEYRSQVTQNFASTCYVRNEKLDLSYSQAMHHFTLYEYNPAGQLIATVPPEGVDFVNLQDSDPAKVSRVPQHRLKTAYVSNSVGELANAYTPEGDLTRYLYDKAGRVRFSQNKEQETRGSQQNKLIFTYAKYDNETARVTETGEYSGAPDAGGQGFSKPDATATGTYASDMVDQLSWPDNNSRLFERNYFSYDQVALNLMDFAQENVQGRVSKVCNQSACTYYSYDKHGRVKLVVQELLEVEVAYQRYKTMEYEYLPLTSQVKQVIYQRNKGLEEFRHRYSYDADNRVTGVEVSRDGSTWEKAAAYEYYLHGPLKSAGLGDFVQRLNYVYTLQGWLKAINHPLQASDPGGDGLAGSQYARDVFAMVLHYYSGDYSRTDKGLDATAAITPQASSHLKAQGKDLFNGNISAITSYTGFDQTSASTTPSLMGQGFRYDVLNRLLGSVTETRNVSGFAGWTGTATAIPNIYRETMSYDPNGNIESLVRTSGSGVMDNMVYNYAKTITDAYGKAKKAHNKLLYVDDDTDVTGLEDFTDQQAGNYLYDAKGRLVQDLKNEIAQIKWTAYDKVAEVIRTSGSTKANLRFSYDATGKRMSKTVTKPGSQPVTTYYTYDATGNAVAVYEKRMTSGTAASGYKYVDIPGMNWTPGNFSVSWWMNPYSLADYNQVIQAKNGWGAFVFHTTATGAVYVGTDVTNRLTPTELPAGTVEKNKWQHFTFTFENGKGSFYKNGKLLGSKPGMLNSVAWTGLLIGHGSASTIDGLVDEIRVYNRFLTADEVASLAAWNGSGSTVTSGLEGYWPLNGTSGTQASDVSGNPTPRHGTLVNGPLWMADGYGRVDGGLDMTGAKNFTYTITEEYMYGAGRLGNYQNGNVVYGTGVAVSTISKASLRFEITDHLGNVRAVVTGTKVTSTTAAIVSLRDYYPFGSEMPGRKVTTEAYRYGFNGQEKDADWNGEVNGEGEDYDFGARIYDDRIGRFLSKDPRITLYASFSAYVYASNSPVRFTDIGGMGTGTPEKRNGTRSVVIVFDSGDGVYGKDPYTLPPTLEDTGNWDFIVVKDFAEAGKWLTEYAKEFGTVNELLIVTHGDGLGGIYLAKDDPSTPIFQEEQRIVAREIGQYLGQQDYGEILTSSERAAIAALEEIGNALSKDAMVVINACLCGGNKELAKSEYYLLSRRHKNQINLFTNQDFGIATRGKKLKIEEALATERKNDPNPPKGYLLTNHSGTRETNSMIFASKSGSFYMMAIHLLDRRGQGTKNNHNGGPRFKP